jgi:hypothetical protein
MRPPPPPIVYDHLPISVELDLSWPYRLSSSRVFRVQLVARVGVCPDEVLAWGSATSALSDLTELRGRRVLENGSRDDLMQRSRRRRSHRDADFYGSKRERVLHADLLLESPRIGNE